MVERICPVCQTPYMADPGRLKYGRQTTCSRKCSYALRASKISNATTQPCAVCGTPTTRSLSHRKSVLSFCSSKCHYAARGLGLVSRVVVQPYNISAETRAQMSESQTARNILRKALGRYFPHSEATKARLRLTTAKAIAEGRIPRVSKLEFIVKKELEILGLPFVHQKMFRDAQGRFVALPDFYLPDQNLVLEVNGTFWHADPREFPQGPLHPSQRRTLSRYQTKMTRLAQLGIPVAEVWERDIRADVQQAVGQALAPYLHLS